MLLCNIRPGSLLLRCSAIILYVDEELHTGYMSEVAQDTQPLIAAEEASVDTQVGTLAERHPDWPSVNLNILFGHHESAADMADVEAALQSGNVNIYFLRTLLVIRRTQLSSFSVSLMLIWKLTLYAAIISTNSLLADLKAPPMSPFFGG